METQKLFLSALSKILRPLVRVMIRYEATLPVVLPLLKQLYVEVAEEFKLDNKALTDSRVSLLTGVHRKDVKQYRHVEPDERKVQRNVSMGSKVIAEWTGNPDYLDDNGEAKALPIAGEMSFSSLVESINNDFRARTLLDEWIRNGTLVVTEAGEVELNPSAFRPAASQQDLMNFFAANISDHIHAAGHNLANADQRWLERAACFDGLSKEAIEELEHYAREEAMQVLIAVNRKAYELAEQCDETEEKGQFRYRFGTYFYHSADDHEARTINSNKGS